MLDANPSRVPIIIDVEASGFGAGSYPIEVGVALEDGRSHCFLIQPAADWIHWDPQAELVHGIDRELLAIRGRPVADVAEQLNALLKFKTVYSDAWGHDQSWLALLYEAAGIARTFRVESVRCLLEETHLSYWKSAKAAAFRELGIARHRATNDALLLQRALTQTLQLEYDARL